MRLVAWNCNMALHRKFDALMTLRPDVAVISECAEPEMLRAHGIDLHDISGPVWIGENKHKGLAAFGFNGYQVEPAEVIGWRLRHILPVHVSGPVDFNLLAVWAFNMQGGITRKHQLGPLRRALSRYETFLTEGPAIVAGDLNHNVFWDKPGYRNNHQRSVDRLDQFGLVSAYHLLSGEAQGDETTPTLYWRDRTKDGPTYHIDYIFFPRLWVPHIREFTVGSFEDWCGSGLSDHVPLVLDVNIM
jgi:exodeoxyribonuclease-3